MSTAKQVVPMKVKKTALALLSERLNVPSEEMKLTLKATAFKECKTDAEFMAAVIVAQTYGLNPFLKEIYAFPSKGGAVIPIVPIDGWISLVNRQDNFNGCDLIENEGEGEGCVKGLKSVTATFYIKGKDNPIKVTEYMAECYDASKEPWKRWPRRMLRHKAYIQGARIAFGFSGIYDPDEGERIIDVEATTVKSGQEEIKAPQSVSQQQAQENANQAGEGNAFKDMIDAFAKRKADLGNERYYKILGGEGFEHANEIREVKTGNRILMVMDQAIKDLNK